MNLLRGVCFLCQNNTKIVLADDAKYITSKITEYIGDQIGLKEFSEIEDILKVCPVCLYDFMILSQLRENIKNFVPHQQKCSLCMSDENLIYIKGWNYFDTILKHITTTKLTKGCICLGCIKYLDIVTKIKQALSKQFPELSKTDNLQTKLRYKKKQKSSFMNNISKQPQVETYDEQVLEKHSKQSTVNNIDLALKHLKPLKNNIFKVNQYKRDKKMYEQIAFVKLEIPNVSKEKKNLKLYGNAILPTYSISNSSNGSKPGFFKIKLKASNAPVVNAIPKTRISKIQGQEYEVTSLPQKQLYVKLLKMDLLEDFEKLKSDNHGNISFSTPTRISGNELVSSSKSRKSVSFSDVLSVEIKEQKKHNIDGTPLKSLLKKSKKCLNRSNITSENNADDSSSEEVNPNSEADADNAEESVENAKQVESLCEIEENKQKPDTTNVETALDESMDSSSEDSQDENHSETIIKSESGVEKQLLMNISKSPDSSNNDLDNERSNDSDKANEESEQFSLELSGDEEEDVKVIEENEVSSTSAEKFMADITYSESNLTDKLTNLTSTESSNIPEVLVESPDTRGLQEIIDVSSKQVETLNEEISSNNDVSNKSDCKEPLDNILPATNEKVSVIDDKLTNRESSCNTKDSRNGDKTCTDKNSMSKEILSCEEILSNEKEMSASEESVDNQKLIHEQSNEEISATSSGQSVHKEIFISKEEPVSNQVNTNTTNIIDDTTKTDEIVNEKTKQSLVDSEDVLINDPEEISGASISKRFRSNSDDDDDERQNKKIKLNDDNDYSGKESMECSEENKNVDNLTLHNVNQNNGTLNSDKNEDSRKDTESNENLDGTTVDKDLNINDSAKDIVEIMLNELYA